MTSQLVKVRPFVYNKLSHQDAIRVFNIRPDKDDSIIRGTLVELILDEAISLYNAISYVWGDATKTSTILCDNQSLTIPASLYTILRRIRRTSRRVSLSIWADSICINQATDQQALNERSNQVAKMGQIFSSAEQVFVDLGDVSSDAYQNLIDLGGFLKDVSWTSEYPSRLRLNLEGKAIVPRPEHAGWHSLVEFMSHPWFTRMWVMQEFAVAKNVVLLFGNDLESNPEFLEKAVKCATYFLHDDNLNRHNALSQFRYPIVNKYLNTGLLHKLRVMHQSGIGISLQLFHDVLLLRENFEATDDRDFVYALLGLAPGPSAMTLKADYNEHSHELGKRLYLHFLASGYGVFGLYQSLGLASSTTSWSIRLRPQPRDILFNVFPAGTSERSNACGNTRAQIHPDDDQSCLNIKAFLVDEILLIFPEIIPNITPSTFAPTVLEPWLYSLLEWLSECNFDPLGSDNQNFSRTVCFGQYTPESDSALPSVIIPFIYARIQALENGSSTSQKPRPADPRSNQIYSRMLVALEVSKARKFVVSLRRRFCFVPEGSQSGDQLAIISGAPQPFVLRPTRNDEGHTFFRIVGACYVDGMMQGEVLDPQLGLQETTIEVR